MLARVFIHRLTPRIILTLPRTSLVRRPLARCICSPACLRVPHSTDEALSDAHFWGRKQKASSATAAYFIGPGHSSPHSTGAIATSARVVGNIKAGDVIPGSIVTSTTKSTAASVASAKAIVTMGIKGSLAVANQAKKYNVHGAKGMMNAAVKMARSAEKYEHITSLWFSYLVY